MRRIWNLFGDGKKPQGNREEGSDADDDTVEVTNAATQTPLSREETRDHTVEASTPVKEDSMDGRRKKSKKKTKNSRSREARTPKKKSVGSGQRKRTKEVIHPSREIIKKEEEPPKHVVVAEAREIAAREDNEEFENDGGAMAKSRMKTRDLKWKEESSSEERKTKAATAVKKIVEAREENKADDEEFENDGKATMARSKIKSRDLKWKSEESPQKERTSEGRSQSMTPRRKHHPVNEKVAEAREENKADDEEFENDGKATMAKSKIKTRDLKWKGSEQSSESSPGKTGSGTDSEGDSIDTRKSRKKKISSKVAEAREENKADDEEFENDGKATMARSKIKSRDLKWKKDEDASTPNRAAPYNEPSIDSGGEDMPPIRKVAEAREENKADDEEFENEGTAMARSKIKSRDLQWKKDEGSTAVAATPKKEQSQQTVGSPDPPPRSAMQQLQQPQSEKRKETTGRSMMLPPSSPASPSPSPASPIPTPPMQSTVRMEVKESKVDKSGATRSRHEKKEDNSRDSADKSFMRNLRPPFNLSRKSKSRSDKKRAIREMPKQQDKSPSDASSHSQISPSSPDKSTRGEKSSIRLEVAASAVDKSVKSIKSIFKKTDDTKKNVEDLLPHVERDARDVTEARRLMEMLKRNNVFENALFPFQNESLRAHFTSGSKGVDKHTMDLLFKATDFVLDKILFRGEELDEYIDNPLKNFILNRAKSRTMVVEHLLRRPEYLPQSWGGRTVVLMRSEEEVNVAPEDDKSKKETRPKREDN